MATSLCKGTAPASVSTVFSKSRVFRQGHLPFTRNLTPAELILLLPRYRPCSSGHSLRLSAAMAASSRLHLIRSALANELSPDKIQPCHASSCQTNQVVSSCSNCLDSGQPHLVFSGHNQRLSEWTTEVAQIWPTLSSS